MKKQLSQYITKYFVDFANYYHQYRVKADRLISVRYRIITTLEEFEKTKKIELAFTDRPGDTLPPMTIQKIKTMSDIIEGMHPVDVNSINDLYYLSKDKIIEVKVDNNKLVAFHNNGKTSVYPLDEPINLELIKSARLSYMIGYMQAERIIREACREKIEYRITQDNISSLYVENIDTNETSLRKPGDILFSEEYKKFSKEDIAKIGYICGQMSNHH